jgi:hypothetical protein
LAASNSTIITQPAVYDPLNVLKKSDSSKLGANQQTKHTANDRSISKTSTNISYIPFPIHEVNQNPPPHFLLWSKWPINPTRSKFSIKQKKRRFLKLMKLLNNWEEQSSIFICPFCEIENYMIKIL